MIVLLIIFTYSINFSMCQLKLNSQYGVVSKLTSEVIEKYFIDHRCIVIVNDIHKLETLNANYTAALRISVENICFDSVASDLVIQAFEYKCDGYVVQVEKAVCFMKLWTATLEKTPARHNPKFLFIPTKPNENFTDEILGLRDTEISSKIAVVEFSNDPEWPINLYGNNFYVPVGTEGRINKFFLDRWNPQSGFENNVDLYPNKLKDLYGKSFRVMTFTYLPYGNVDPLDGSEVRLVIEFCRRLNCTLEVVDDGNFWGTIQGNGSGDGGAGMVYKDEADVSLGGVYLWLDNYFYTDYSHTYLYAAVTLLVPKPQPLGGWRVPFLPFGGWMWLCLGFVVVFSSFFMYLITLVTMKYTRFREEIQKSGQFLTYIDSFITMTGLAVLQQPSVPLVRNSPIRHLFTAFEFFFLIITSCYGAGLASYLTIPQFTKPIDTFFELAESGLVWLANHEAWVFTLQHVDDDEVQKVVRNFRKKTQEELLQLVDTGKYGVSLERLPGGHFSEQPHLTDHLLQNSHIMADNLYGSPLTVLLRKGSPYTKTLDHLISRLVENGILLYWEGAVARRFLNSRKQLTLKLAKSVHGEQGPKKISVNNIEGMFIIYASGITIASCVLIWEIISVKLKKKKSLAKKVAD